MRSAARGSGGTPAALRTERYLSVLERLVSAARSPQLVVDGSEPAAELLARLLQSETRRLREVADPLRVGSEDAAWRQVGEVLARLRGLATCASSLVRPGIRWTTSREPLDDEEGCK